MSKLCFKAIALCLRELFFKAIAPLAIGEMEESILTGLLIS
ncbi:hypothetical protein [Nostoc sp. TCL26-01]|nr:hypothetical protein [Nostoc sp. TCL26-01]